IQKQLDEQKKINESLQNKMDRLEQMITACCAANSTGAANKTKAVNLSDRNVIVLNQNVPNPFAESTVISYNIPTDFTKAQLQFSTSDGKVIKVVDVTEKGEGQLNVFANDLSNGMYSYSLIVDGKVIDTKKMVKQN
ncbi:MAG: Collagen triple helix repeat-containing protein, partial [Bacteroidetes bacterium]|nr:Collagen triple helix repeat-containing protein [Bacteroidota bacterium]